MPVKEIQSKPELLATIVTFQMGSQTYALPIAPVHQIIEMVTITPLPQVNKNVAGVINFHGALVPVINLRCHFGLAELPLQLHTPIILVMISGRLVGLIVDKVLDVLERPADEIIDPNNILVKEMGQIPLLQGLIQSQDGSILLLNPEQLLKPYDAHSLLEAVDTLAQNMDPSGPTGVNSLPSVGTPPPVQTAQTTVQNLPKVRAGKRSRNHASKKSAAGSPPTKEVAE